MDKEKKIGFNLIGMDRVIKELFIFNDIMKEAGVEFFLHGGTCLGIVRDHKLIDYDKDIDIGVMGDDMFKYLGSKLEGHFENVHITGPKEGRILWAKKDMGEDLCLPIEIQAFYKKGNVYFYNRKMGQSWDYKKMHVAWYQSCLLGFDNIVFEGVEFKVPHKVSRFLTAFYGSDWFTPKRYTDWRYNCGNLGEGYF